jgi:hypothetical protein
MKQKKKGGTTKTERYAQYAIIAILLLVLSFTLGKITSQGPTGLATGIGIVSASEIIPQGIPLIYGEEIGISYDDVSSVNPQLTDQTIKKLSQYEDRALSDGEMQRYIRIAGSISCEYCCGADSIVFSNGQRACGCAHSYAMRGLAKYLIIEHPEISDKEVLSELGKWKVLFFPEIHEQKAQVLESQGIDSKDYINLASNAYRGIEKGQLSSGSMVGGC